MLQSTFLCHTSFWINTEESNMVKRLSALLLLALCCAPIALAQECAAIVQDALDLTEQLCSITERNQACYGNIDIESVPQPDAANFKFDAPGDIVSVSDIQTLNLSALTAPDEWGVAMLSLQADLPDTIPGQNVTVLLFGGTAIENAGTPQPPTVNVSAGTTINVRSGPGTSNRVVSQLKPSEALTSDGQNEAGEQDGCLPIWSRWRAMRALWLWSRRQPPQKASPMHRCRRSISRLA
jgi:hypothetical protein